MCVRRVCAACAACAAWACLCGPAALPAGAAFITNLIDSDGDVWVASGPDYITFQVTQQDPATGQTLRVSEVINYAVTNTATVSIAELKRATVNAGGSMDPQNNPRRGLNFLIDETYNNQTTNDAWGSFRENLFDPTPVDPKFASAGHAQFPHFHNDRTAFNPDAVADEFDNGNLLLLNGLDNPILPDKSLKVTSLRVHEIKVTGAQRTVLFAQTPILVPEPASATLLGVAAVTSMLYGLVRHRRVRPRR